MTIDFMFNLGQRVTTAKGSGTIERVYYEPGHKMYEILTETPELVLVHEEVLQKYNPDNKTNAAERKESQLAKVDSVTYTVDK